MYTRLDLSILPQPDDITCGPTCLHAVYRYLGDDAPLRKLIHEIPQLEGGGTLAVLLGVHALRRGYDAKIYTYNIQIFDPTWFQPGGPALRDRLLAQFLAKRARKLRTPTRGYMDFLNLGGQVLFEDLTAGLIRRYLKQGIPLLTGLSSTYLYRCARELSRSNDYDDIRGEPAGHFVVLCGYREKDRSVLVADPLLPNPVTNSQTYWVSIDRLVCAILLGIVTYDANLLIVTPKPGSAVKGREGRKKRSPTPAGAEKPAAPRSGSRLGRQA